MKRYAITGSCLLTILCLAAASCLIPEDLSECQSNEDCRNKYNKRSYCADDNVCEEFTREEYLAEPCGYQTFGQPYESDSPVIGAILAGNANDDNLLTSVKIAYQEFTNAGVDLSVVMCSSNSVNDQARRAAEHLAKIGVEAVVGPDSSSQVIEIARDVFIPNNMMSVSPAATSGVISNLQDDNLIWRTIPSDEFQAEALAKLALSRMGLAPDASSLEGNKLLVASKSDDAYTQGLRGGIIDTLSTEITNSDNFKTVDFTNPDSVDGLPSYSDLGQSIADFGPDVVLLFGTEEVWSIVEETEGAYGQSADRPLYITGDGGRVTVSGENPDSLAESAINNYPAIADNSRVIGTKPTINYAGNAVYSSFANKWESEKNLPSGQSASDFPFIAEAYDAFFLIGIASLGAETFEAGAITDQIPNISDPMGEVIDANQNGVNVAINKFSNDETFQMRGATGRFNFDENGNPNPSPISLWCLERDNTDDAVIREVSDFLLTDESGFTARNCPNSLTQ